MDQVEAIARLLQKGGLGVDHLLTRNSVTQQKKLSKLERKANASTAYNLDPRRTGDTPSKVVLIDDVYTTGATLDACARALRSGGTGELAAVVLAAD